MQVKFEQTRQQQIEVALWLAGTGEVTPAVHDAITRNSLSFAAALITREKSDAYLRN